MKASKRACGMPASSQGRHNVHTGIQCTAYLFCLRIGWAIVPHAHKPGKSKPHQNTLPRSRQGGSTLTAPRMLDRRYFGHVVAAKLFSITTIDLANGDESDTEFPLTMGVRLCDGKHTLRRCGVSRGAPRPALLLLLLSSADYDKAHAPLGAILPWRTTASVVSAFTAKSCSRQRPHRRSLPNTTSLLFSGKVRVSTGLAPYPGVPAPTRHDAIGSCKLMP